MGGYRVWCSPRIRSRAATPPDIYINNREKGEHLKLDFLMATVSVVEDPHSTAADLNNDLNLINQLARCRSILT